MHVKRIAACTHIKSKGRHFSTFFAHFGLPWVRPWDNRGKYYMSHGWKDDSMLVKRLAVYPSIFNRFPVIQADFDFGP